MDIRSYPSYYKSEELIAKQKNLVLMGHHFLE